jgi:hypothetical protein
MIIGKEQRKDRKTKVENTQINDIFVENSINNQNSYSLIFAYGGNNKVATPVQNCTPNTEISLSKLIELIKSDAPNNALRVQKITKKGFEIGTSATEIKNQIKSLKKSLPFVLFSGFCPVHHNNESLIYNGAIQVDIDFKFIGGDQKAIELKEVVKNLPFVILAAISPSGYGLKCLIATDNNDIDLHGKVSKALIFELSKVLNIDSKYFDNLGASQPCFLPYDKNVFFNANFTQYNAFKALYTFEQNERKETKKQLLKATKTAQNITYSNANDTQNGSFSVPTIKILEYLTSEIVRSNFDITSGYNVWFAVASAYASCGEVGRSLFHSVAAINSEYDYQTNDKKFDNGLIKGQSNVGYIVNRCKEVGIYTNDFCKDYVRTFAPKSNNFLAHGIIPGSTINHYLLNDNQFIGDVLTAAKFKKGINFLIGGTGTGKTFFTAQNFEKTIVVSRNITTLQNFEKYGFERFLMKDSKTDFIDLQDGSKITVTYKSLEKLLKQLDTKDYVFVFDEFHLLTDAYRDVRKETQFSYNVLERLQHTNKVILASANDVFISDSRLKIQSKHYFKKTSIKRFVNVIYKANFTELKKTINNRLLEGSKVLLYTNRKEDKNVSILIKEHFVNNSILFFDATKHSIDLTNLKHDITVCTKALTTGKDVENNDLAVIIYCDDYDMKRSVINQFFGRARDYKTASFDLLFTFKSDNESYKYKEPEKLFWGCKNIAKSVIDASVNDIAFLHENEKYFVDKQEGKMVVNYYSIDNHIETQMSKITIRNTKILSEFLYSHGYDCGISEVENEIPVKTQKIGLSNSEKYANEIEIIYKKLDSDFEFETTAKFRVEALQKIGFSKNKSLLHSLRNDSTLKWNRFIRLLLCEVRLMNDKTFLRDYDNVLEKLGNDYYTSFEVVERLQKLRKTKTILGREIGLIKTFENDKKNQRAVLKLLKKYFEINDSFIEREKGFKLLKSENLTEKQTFQIHENDFKTLFKLQKIV